MSVNVSYISYISPRQAQNTIAHWLPPDAERTGRLETNDIGDAIRRYQSDSAAPLLSEDDHPWIEEPGTIWAMYWPVDGEVGVIIISLFDPTEYLRFGCDFYH